MESLKPCPICGAKVKVVGGPEDWTPTFNDPDSGGDPYHITCSCGIDFAIGYCESTEIIKKWNRRSNCSCQKD